MRFLLPEGRIQQQNLASSLEEDAIDERHCVCTISVWLRLIERSVVAIPLILFDCFQTVQHEGFDVCSQVNASTKYSAMSKKSCSESPRVYKPFQVVHRHIEAKTSAKTT